MISENLINCMKLSKMIHKELIFPTPIYIHDFKNLTLLDKPKNYILNYAKKLFVSETCWSTEDNLHTQDAFFDFNLEVKKIIKEIFDDIGIKREEEVITCMWANVSKKLNRHNLHLHPNSFFSGVVYINAPKNSGNIGFKDPRTASELLAFDFEPNSIFEHRTIEVEPVTGRMIIFPSWLYHGTRQGEFSDNENRISLSFNVIPKTNVIDYSRKINFS